MSSPAFLAAPDAAQRAEAIDPRESFLVQAPAGSGKTELLIQRFLRLLAEVDRPEAIVAITFTRKAAGEMVDRIMNALREARAQSPVDQPHQQFTRALAEAALARDRERGWNLLEHPARLRVQTIDSLCVAIAAEMPWLTRLGGMPAIEEDATELYREAARRTLLHVDDPEYGVGVVHLLRHLDNEAAHARNLIADMLARREQWIALAVQAGEKARQPLEEALRRLMDRRCGDADRLMPAHLREPWIALARYAGRDVATWPGANDAATWKKLLEIVLTEGGAWRQQLTRKHGFPPENRMRKQEAQQLIAALEAVPGMRDALAAVRDLPPRELADSQWDATLALLQTLKFSMAQLREVFREKRATDFVEIGIAARNALEESGVGTDLAFRLDSRIRHLLVDEFQDTSRGQCKLIEQLISNWSPEDGRTLFLVGDPMQSIYRFRQAEVGIFLETRAAGIGPLRPKFLQLVSNYRSQAAIVDRINQMFQGLFPPQEDAALGAVPFHASEARDAALPEGVTIHGFAADDAHGKEAEKAEAARIVVLIRDAQARAPRKRSRCWCAHARTSPRPWRR